MYVIASDSAPTLTSRFFTEITADLDTPRKIHRSVYSIPPPSRKIRAEEASHMQALVRLSDTVGSLLPSPPWMLLVPQLFPCQAHGRWQVIEASDIHIWRGRPIGRSLLVSANSLCRPAQISPRCTLPMAASLSRASRVAWAGPVLTPVLACRA